MGDRLDGRASPKRQTGGWRVLNATAMVILTLLAVVPAGLGIAAVLDLISLRDLVAAVGLSWLSPAVLALRQRLGHDLAQLLELSVALGGIGLLAGAWLNRARSAVAGPRRPR